ncbi:MAG: SufD family Fe-S cluster assembly protein [Candidatus Moraniibacteriota bacterium]|nr:MAG: SufD family Fe-S cluster assembly protein [Candidatus Moranbacteria bacterium]
MIHFQDISQEDKCYYQIVDPGIYVYFFENKTADITFSIETSHASVWIFGMYKGKENDHYSLSTKQLHKASNSSSHLILKSALEDNSKLIHNAIIRIEKNALKTNASLESKHLLLGKGAHAEAQPNLEILADDVCCSHAVTTSPIHPDSLFFLNTRGLSYEKAKKLLSKGFLNALQEKMNQILEKK